MRQGKELQAFQLQVRQSQMLPYQNRQSISEYAPPPINLDAYHSVPTIRIPGKASLRKVQILFNVKASRMRKPPHVSFSLWCGDNAVITINMTKASQYVIESASGDPSSRSGVWCTNAMFRPRLTGETIISAIVDRRIIPSKRKSVTNLRLLLTWFTLAL